MGILNLIFALLVYLALLSSTRAAVSLTVSGLAATIKNSYVELVFKSDATISALHVNGKQIANHKKKTFYLDWTENAKEGTFKPKSIHIVEQTDSRVHFYWLQHEIEHEFAIELHYIMEDALGGIYCYAKYTNDKTYNVAVQETRMVFRFDAATLNQGTNSVRDGTIPTTSQLSHATNVADATYRFSNGTYYTKYDYAVYIRETHYQGVYGNGYGAFVISPSREYHGGGPLKQDLTVHDECLITNYFMSEHLTGTPELTAPPGWVHVYGPFLLYFPTGDNGQIISQVQNQASTEIGNWPYSFINDKAYPLKRGRVSGDITGQRKARVVVWDSVNEDFNIQQLGYLYWADTDDKGYYLIDDIRPGNYKIAAYPLAGQGSENMPVSTVTITAGGREHVGFDLPEPGNIIWSLGQADRRAWEFHLADQPRNYEWDLNLPTTLTFTIGSSNPYTDWYYAQPKNSQWYIKYQDTQDGSSRTLRIALAAASSKPHLVVTVNGHKVGDDSFDNDAAIYRSAMQSGRYYSKVYTVNSAQIVNGENTIELQISSGQVMYDCISLQRV